MSTSGETMFVLVGMLVHKCGIVPPPKVFRVSSFSIAAKKKIYLVVSDSIHLLAHKSVGLKSGELGDALNWVLYSES